MHRAVSLTQGDITKISVDAIVNAANSSLAGGGGVDGAIHRAGGPAIMAELDVIRARDGGCPTGGAVVTTAGLLPARFVFHAVGPVYGGGRRNEAALLGSCYARCMELAESHGVKRISFPSISTGVYGYPLDEAAPIALRTVGEWLARSVVVESAVFVLFDARSFEAYQRALEHE